MKIVVDRARCMASGNCVMVAPEIFAQDEEGLVQVLIETPPPDKVKSVEEAVRGCPAAVISLIDK